MIDARHSLSPTSTRSSLVHRVPFFWHPPTHFQLSSLLSTYVINLFSKVEHPQCIALIIRHSNGISTSTPIATHICLSQYGRAIHSLHWKLLHVHNFETLCSVLARQIGHYFWHYHVAVVLTLTLLLNNSYIAQALLVQYTSTICTKLFTLSMCIPLLEGCMAVLPLLLCSLRPFSLDSRPLFLTSIKIFSYALSSVPLRYFSARLVVGGFPLLLRRISTAWQTWLSCRLTWHISKSGFSSHQLHIIHIYSFQRLCVSVCIWPEPTKPNREPHKTRACFSLPCSTLSSKASHIRIPITSTDPSIQPYTLTWSPITRSISSMEMSRLVNHAIKVAWSSSFVSELPIPLWISCSWRQERDFAYKVTSPVSR